MRKTADQAERACAILFRVQEEQPCWDWEESNVNVSLKPLVQRDGAYLWGDSLAWGNMFGNKTVLNKSAFKLEKRLLALLLVHEAAHTEQWGFFNGDSQEKEAYQIESDTIRAWKLEPIPGSLLVGPENSTFVGDNMANFRFYGVKNPAWK